MKLETLVDAFPSRTLTGRALHLLQPISFWGGVSPVNAQLTDPRSPHAGTSIAGRVLFIRELRGSSSASSVLLELAYLRIAPAAIVLAAPDAILALGALVAAEMQWPTPGMFRCGALEQSEVPDNAMVSILEDGSVAIEERL
jgi:predicted aconitase with swiveling domain